MSDTSGEMVHLYFLFKRDPDGIHYRLSAFKAAREDAWRLLDPQWQSVDHHAALWSDDVSARVIGHAQRTITMDIDAATAAPFLCGAYTALHDSFNRGDSRHRDGGDDDDADGTSATATFTSFTADNDDNGATASAVTSGATAGTGARSKQPDYHVPMHRHPTQATAGDSDPSMESVMERMVRTQSHAIGLLQQQLVEQQRQTTSIVDALQNLLGNGQQRNTKKMTVTQFDGSSSSAEAWIMLYERACLSNGWLDDASKVNSLKAAFKPGSAADKWFDSRLLNNANAPWAEWKLAFEAAFKQNFADSTARALRYTYRGGSVLEFFYELERLLTMAYGSTVVAADGYRLLINNVTVALPRDMQQQIINSDPHSKAELITSLQRLTSQPRGPRPPNERPHADIVRSDGNMNSSRPQWTSDRNKPSTFQSHNSSYRPTGHQSRSQSVTPRAQTSQRTAAPRTVNATETRPKTVAAQVTGQEPEKPVSKTGNDNHTVAAVQCSALQSLPIYMVHAEPGNLSLRTLLDTGSDNNLIASKFAVRHGLEVRKGRESFLDFAGMPFQASQFVSLKLTLGQKSVMAKLWLFNNLSFDMLIGYPTLLQLNVRLTVSPDAARINAVQSQTCMIENKDDIVRLFPRLLRSIKDRQTEYVVEFKIRSDAPVLAQKPYRLSPLKAEFVNETTKQMLADGLLEQTDSAYAAPTVVVQRKDNPDGTPGKLRMCTDFRMINEWTVQDPFPLPVIDDLLKRAGGAKWFTKIDLRESFYQVPLTQETRQFTALVAPGVHLQYTGLPFGWKNSAQKFQRFMTVHVLSDLLHDRRIGNYVDDTFVAAATKEECQQLTFRVLQRFDEKGLLINLVKSEVCVPQIKLLGRLLDGVTRTTRSECREKALQAADPYDLHTLRSFCGLVEQFRDRIPHFSDIMRPLNRLRKKGVPFEWDEQCKAAKHQLMDLITSDPILCFPDWSLPFELSTDASHVGTGGCLYQKDDSCTKYNQLRLIGFCSYTFNKHEIHYDVCQKEALAAIKGIKHFRTYLEGRRFVLRTDHMALLALKSMDEPRGKLARWKMFLLSFDAIIVHRKGNQQHDADAISRLCVGDSMCSSLIRSITPETKSHILAHYHDSPESGMHGGVSRTMYKIASRFSWPNMLQDVKAYVDSCYVCQMTKHRFRAKPDYAVVPPYAKTPYETVHVDFGELLKKREGVKST